jgi:hypothetical protein
MRANRARRWVTGAVGLGSLLMSGQVFAQQQPPFQPPMGPFGRGGWSPWGGEGRQSIG